jgi:hypothetical protein
VSSEVITLLNAGEADYFAGHPDKAKVEFEKALKAPIDELHPWFRSRLLIHLAGVYLRLDEEDRAAETLVSAEKTVVTRLGDGDESGLAREYMARICALRGNVDEMLAWLQKAIDAGWRTYSLAVVNPAYEEFTENARFARMIDEVRADVADMRRRADKERSSQRQ